MSVRPSRPLSVRITGSVRTKPASRLRVYASGFRVLGILFRVHGLGFRVGGCRLVFGLFMCRIREV